MDAFVTAWESGWNTTQGNRQSMPLDNGYQHSDMYMGFTMLTRHFPVPSFRSQYKVCLEVWLASRRLSTSARSAPRRKRRRFNKAFRYLVKKLSGEAAYIKNTYLF